MDNHHKLNFSAKKELAPLKERYYNMIVTSQVDAIGRKKTMLLTTLFMVIFLFTIMSVDAEINNFAPVKTNECVLIKQVCASCSYINLSIAYPNSSLAVTNDEMNDEGGGTWTYEFCETLMNGRYDVTGSGDLGGTPTGFDVLYFEVSATGKDLTSAKAGTYIIIIAVSILILGGLLWFGFAIPAKNRTDEMTGYIISLNNLKYLKYVILGFAYLTLVWISYYAWMLVYAYLDFDFLTNLFRFIFIFLVVLIFPIFIIGIYIIIANMIRDSKVWDSLQRGLRVR